MRPEYRQMTSMMELACYRWQCLPEIFSRKAIKRDLHVAAPRSSLRYRAFIFNATENVTRSCRSDNHLARVSERNSSLSTLEYMILLD